jgi:hypothetical protein
MTPLNFARELGRRNLSKILHVRSSGTTLTVRIHDCPVVDFRCEKKLAVNKTTDPRLVWIATVLAAAVFVLYVTHI